MQGYNTAMGEDTYICFYMHVISNLNFLFRKTIKF